MFLDGCWRNWTQDWRGSHGLQANHRSLDDSVLLHRGPGEHRPDVSVLVNVVHQPVCDVYRPRRALRSACTETDEPSEPFHVLALLQCLSVALRKGQGRLRAVYVLWRQCVWIIPSVGRSKTTLCLKKTAHVLTGSNFINHPPILIPFRIKNSETFSYWLHVVSAWPSS